MYGHPRYAKNGYMSEPYNMPIIFLFITVLYAYKIYAMFQPQYAYIFMCICNLQLEKMTLSIHSP